MKEQNGITASEIDQIVRQNKWVNFHVLEYNGRSLSIAGGIDLSDTHTLEIIFEDVFYASVYFEGWHTNTKDVVIEIPSREIEKELNMKLEIEQGYQLFIMHPEDYNNEIYVAAKSIYYKTNNNLN